MSVLEDARAVLATGPVCDACLGRVFADRSFGLTNAERGRALRTTVALADDEPYESPEDCWVCEGVCQAHEKWADRVVAALEGVDFDTYQVGTRVPPLVEENDVLLREDAGLDDDAGEPFKSAFNREVGKRVGEATGTEVDFERPDVVALLNLERGDVDVQVHPAFVYGRYRKRKREIPQTEWPCRECGGSGKQFDSDDGEVDCDHCDGTGYLYPTSVEEEVAPPIREAMAGEEAVFHGAGREDVDARMLGSGRPFVVEVKEPTTRRPDVEALQADVNERADGVGVTDLALASHEMVERVKELDASKRYRAVVAFGEPVDAGDLAAALAELDGATVTQHTPERVDHRRASKDRTRTVYAANGRLVADGAPGLDELAAGDLAADWDGDSAAAEGGDPPADGKGDEPAAGVGDLPAVGDALGLDDDPDRSSRAIVQFHTEGGTYVKELVSSDDGRTEPSLVGQLGVAAEVTALDVLDVAGEDEAFADPAYLLEQES